LFHLSILQCKSLPDTLPSNTVPFRATYPAVFSTIASPGQYQFPTEIELHVPLISFGGRTTPGGGLLTASNESEAVDTSVMAAGAIVKFLI